LHNVFRHACKLTIVMLIDQHWRYRRMTMFDLGACEFCKGVGRVRRVVERDRHAQRWRVREFGAGTEPADSVVVDERQCPLCGSHVSLGTQSCEPP
jgi:hypothetical protein